MAPVPWEAGSRGFVARQEGLLSPGTLRLLRQLQQPAAPLAEVRLAGEGREAEE